MQNANGTVYRYYVTAGNNTIVISRPGNGTTVPYYLTTDHLGSTATATDQTGALVVRADFFAADVAFKHRRVFVDHFTTKEPAARVAEKGLGWRAI